MRDLAWADQPVYLLRLLLLICLLALALASSGQAKICSVVPSATYVEAEHFNRAGRDFRLSSRREGASGTGFIRTSRHDTSFPPATRPVEYELHFPKPGIYYLAVRGKTSDQQVGRLWYGINGVAVGDIRIPAGQEWRWGQSKESFGTALARLELKSAGINTVNFWAMDAGFKLDGFYLSSSSDISSLTGQATVPSFVATLNPLDPFRDRCGTEEEGAGIAADTSEQAPQRDQRTAGSFNLSPYHSPSSQKHPSAATPRGADSQTSFYRSVHRGGGEQLRRRGDRQRRHRFQRWQWWNRLDLSLEHQHQHQWHHRHNRQFQCRDQFRTLAVVHYSFALIANRQTPRVAHPFQRSSALFQELPGLYRP